MSNTWISRPAVLWVLYEAPDVPAHLLSTLLAVAVYTGEDGKGSYISASTVAQLTRKTESQAKRCVRELEKLGLIRRGNQRLVAHIRSDRRPIVYDLPMPERGSAHATPSRGSAHATPQANGVARRPARGSTQGPNGVAPVLPEEVLNRTGIGERDADSAPTPLARQADPGHISDVVAELRASWEGKRMGPVVNSAGPQRLFEMLGNGEGIVFGTAEDMRRMATLLALDAELQHIGLQSSDDEDHGDQAAGEPDDEGEES